MIIILLLTLTSVTAFLFFMSQPKNHFNKKIIILGFDGLSPDIVEKLMAEGRLPFFTQLKEMGSYQHLATSNPAQSPVAWSGIVTGKNPGKHGIYDFIVRDPKDYSLSLSLSEIKGSSVQSTLKEDGFWQYSSRKKIPTVVIGCPMTFPAQKIYGRMLSGMGVPDILGTEGTFSFYTTEDVDKEAVTGGKIFHINKSKMMISHFIGPAVTNIFGKTENVKIPFKITVTGQDNATIEYETTKLHLNKNHWSDWQGIVFPVGPLRAIKGIVKFYLVEAFPEFKLYISPFNLDPQDPFLRISYPLNYSKELASAIGLYHTQGMPLDSWAVNEKRLDEKAFLEHANDVFEQRKTLLGFELSRFQSGILFCYFGMPDTIQHMFWRYIDPGHPLYNNAEAKDYQNIISEWYQKMDNVLGETLKNLGPRDIVIVLSDHGFNSFRRAVHLNNWLYENGYLAVKSRFAYENDSLLEAVDWPRTKAYAIGFGGIYINQKNREQRGIINPGKETQALKEEIAQKLSQWIDEKNNQRIVHRVYRGGEIFHGKYSRQAPDLYVGFNIGYEASWQTALGGIAKTLIEDNTKKWSGSHLFDPSLVPGIIFSNKKMTKGDPSIYDITPTILKIIGYPEKQLKAFDMDGQPLFN